MTEDITTNASSTDERMTRMLSLLVGVLQKRCCIDAP